MLWTDASSREFIAEHYSWFLDTFDDYTYAIQRADAIRYFVLHYYGGIYMDLDIGCLRPMDPLLIYSVILPKTIPVGVSNDLMFAEKGHPLLEQTIHNLVTFDHSWILNYPTVMFSTGPMFLSAQYGLYTTSHPTSAGTEIRILPKSLYGKNAKPGEVPHSFFSHFYGSSWHADDAAFIGFLGTWGKVLMWFGLLVLVIGLIRLPTTKRRSLRRIGGYEILLPRLSRSGRWHLRLGSSASTSPQLPSPISSQPDSPTDNDVPVLHLPLNIRRSSSTSESSSSQDPFAGRVESPIVDAFRRVRNRMSMMATSPREAVPITPIRPRRQPYSWGVLFFLPAIFTQPQDIELEEASPSSSIPPLYSSLDVPISREPRLPSEKNQYRQDVERGESALDGVSESASHAPHSWQEHDLPLNISDPPRGRRARNRSSSRHSSPRRDPWDNYGTLS